jgi:hypothetical protein
MLRIYNENLVETHSKKKLNKYNEEIVETDFTTTSRAVDPNAESREGFHNGPRTVMKLDCADNNYSQYNLTFSTSDSKVGNVNVLAKAFPTNKYDKELLLLAIPFNGIIKPIGINKDFKIFRCTIVNCSHAPITMNGPDEKPKEYRKILYCVLAPAFRALLATDDSHKDETKLNIEFYQKSYEDDTKSIKTTFSAACSLNADHTLKVTYDWKAETVPFMDMSIFRDTPLYVAFKYHKPGENRITTDNASTENSSASQPESSQTSEKTNTESYNKPSYHQDNYRQNYGNRSGYGHKYEDDDDDYDSNHHKTGNGHRNKKRR